MKVWTIGGRIGIGLVLLAGVAHAQLAAPPQDCNYPASLDDFQRVSIGERWTALLQNKVNCAINQLERLQEATGVPETQCTPVTVQAGNRSLVQWTLASTTVGTEPAFLSVIDANNPPGWVEPSGIAGVSGFLASAYVFNHDQSNARAVRACIQVIR